MALTALAVHLHVGIPPHDQTQISELAHTAVGGGSLYGFFQLTSGLLLLSAASSSFQAGPGLLKALARPGPSGEDSLLPRALHRTNKHHTPVAAVAIYALISIAIILVASGQEQELVLVYAVAVFVSFLAGLLAMARFSMRRGARGLALMNLVGAILVAFTLIVNLARGYPLLSLAGTILIAGLLYWRWDPRRATSRTRRDRTPRRSRRVSNRGWPRSTSRCQRSRPRSASTTSGIAWVVNGYALTFGALLLLGGRSGDMLGRRNVFVATLGAFALASAIGGRLEPDDADRGPCRAGRFGGVRQATALSLIVSTFPAGAARNRAVGVFAAMEGLGAAAGLLLGGLVVEYISWRWVFFLNVPVAASAALLAPRLIPAPTRWRAVFDLPGAATATVGLGLLVFGLSGAADHGWTTALTRDASSPACWRWPPSSVLRPAPSSR